MLPLFVLLWKHFTVRRRRYIHTSLEMISTILGILLVFLLRRVFYYLNEDDSVGDSVSSRRSPEVYSSLRSHKDDDINYAMDSISGPLLVYYTPVTNVTRPLMLRVGQKLGLREIDPGEFEDGVDSGIYGVHNVSDVQAFTDKMGSFDSFVVFENEAKYPQPSLNYTIKLKSDFRLLQNLSNYLGVTDHPNDPFLRLQWLIDTTFLESLSGTAITKNLTFHEVSTVKTDKKELNMASSIMILFILLINSFALMLPFVFLMSRYIEEKVSGHLEMLKMNGVSMLTSMVSHLLNVLPTGLFFSLVTAVLMKISRTPIVPVTNFCFLFWVHLIYFYSIMHWALLCSFVVNRSNYSTGISSLMFFMLGVPGFILNTIEKPVFLTKLVCLIFPKAAMDLFYIELAFVEGDGTGITLSSMFRAHIEITISYHSVCLLLVLQMMLVSLLVLWLHRVRPGPYGTPEPCSSTIPFCGKKKKPGEDLPLEQEQDTTPRDPKYYEDPPQNKEVGIKIVNVSKVFGDGTTALSNVTFDIYRGEIMVLLGHNGAGKTTLLSILTGMIPSSGGKIYVSGHDVENAQSKVRNEIGYCTQHDMFIPYLTILEQVRFFAMLKGQSFNEARTTSAQLLEELNIRDRAHYKSHELSGGMKRRLQLACALAGGSTVLVLDEPTSGLDVETRRELWDLLLELRGTRTMVLTTHYMEEADALGDRVAALHQGTLRCHATPMHLKKNIGSGYRLTLMTRGPPKEAEITQLVTSSVPEAFLKDKGTNQVTYDLASEKSAQFPALFENLENQQAKLDIESIGVSMPTLEEVFLRLCSNVETNISDDTQLAGMHMAGYKKLTGCALFKRQAIVLIKRHCVYMLEYKWSVLLWQVILPVCLIFVMTYYFYKEDEPPQRKRVDKKVVRSDGENTDGVKTFRRIFNPTVVFNAENRRAVEPMADSLQDIRFKEVNDDQDEIIQKGQMQLYREDKYLAGITLNKTHVKITFKKGMYDVASIALNILANIMAADQLGGSRRTIHTRQQPIVTARSGPERQGMLEIPKPVILPDIDVVFFMIRYVAIFFFVMMGNAASMASRERLTGTRNIYIMSGCSVSVFWICRLLFFFVFYFVVLLVPLIIALVAFPSSRMIWSFEPLAVLVIIFICGCFSWLCFVFLIGLFASERITSAVCLGLTVVLIIFVVPIAAQADIPKEFGVIAYILLISKVLVIIGTPALYGMAMQKISLLAYSNAYCDLNRHLCPFLFPIKPPFDYKKCCLNQRMVEYLSFGKFSPLPYILLMLVHFAIYLALLLLIEKGWFHNKFRREYHQHPRQFNDPMVQAEKAYVDETFQLPKNQIQDVMLVYNLHKKFCCKDIPAVNGVSFSIKQGECFGVLGVNGAGKSTTFRMIVGEIASSHGTSFANSHFLVSERQEYLQSLSYCPQFLGLDTYMTGYQNVRTLLTIRGLEEPDVQKEIELCFDVVGLQMYKHKKVSEYSGGCQRRLAAGTALSSGAAVTLLDEPTCGVDVTARRRVWANIQQSLRQKRAVIITSHSMDEMETLSNRLAILSRGEVRVLGSPGALRAAHAAGHAIVFKLASTVPADGSIAALKAEVRKTFNCTLKDEHSTMLRYHIDENMKNSQLFKELEKLKAKFGDLIEDYSVSATTLEEVFLAIAQEFNFKSEKKRTQDVKRQP